MKKSISDELKNIRIERLKECRKAKRMSQKQLADASGVSDGLIKGIEAGLRSMDNSAERLAAALGVRVEYLLGVDDYATSQQLAEHIRRDDNGISQLLISILNESDLFRYSCIWFQDEDTKQIHWRIKDGIAQKTYQVEDSTMQDLGQDLIDYLTMRLEKRVLPKAQIVPNDDYWYLHTSDFLDKLTGDYFESGFTDSRVLKAQKMRRGKDAPKTPEPLPEQSEDDPTFD